MKYELGDLVTFVGSYLDYVWESPVAKHSVEVACGKLPQALCVLRKRSIFFVLSGDEIEMELHVLSCTGVSGYVRYATDDSFKKIV